MIELTVSRALALAAQRAGNKVALRCGTRQLTHLQLDAAANQLGQALLARGLQRGDRVAVVLPNCMEYVVIAMAWACRPRLIICDEPTTALDVTVQKQVLRLIHRLAGDGQGVLLVTHDLGVVAKLCRSLSVIHAGRILEEGSVEAVFAQPQHAYTRALLAATPRFDRPDHTLLPVDDDLIDSLNAQARAYDSERGVSACARLCCKSKIWA